MTGFSDGHDELRAVARDLLGRSGPVPEGGGPAAPLDWARMARAGWLGLEVPERLGGAGATFAEVAVVLEEMGRAVTTSPYLGSAVLAVGLLHRLEACDQVDGLLRDVASGRLRLAVGMGAGEDLDAPLASFFLEPSAGSWTLSGQACFVPDAPEADLLLLLATGPGDEAFVVGVSPSAPGMHVAGDALVDQSRSLGSIRAEAVAVPDQAVWRSGARSPRDVHDRGALAVACDSLGLAETALEATVSYALVRQQFGRPIGSFQAVKHACADMSVQLGLCRELVLEAVGAVSEQAPDAWVPVSRAKQHVSQAAVEVAGKAMQLHGGIGYTWESGVHRFLKRAALNRSLFGSPAAHRARLGSRYG